jgi:hypothetical protein
MDDHSAYADSSCSRYAERQAAAVIYVCGPGLEFAAEVGMVVVVDDGDKENPTMSRRALEVFAGSGDSNVLLVCIEQSYSSSSLPQRTL